MKLRIGLAAGFAAGVYVANLAHRRSQAQPQTAPPAAARRGVGQAALDAMAGKATAALTEGMKSLRDAMAAKLRPAQPADPPFTAPTHVAEVRPSAEGRAANASSN